MRQDKAACHLSQIDYFSQNMSDDVTIWNSHVILSQYGTKKEYQKKAVPRLSDQWESVIRKRLIPA